MTIGLSSITGEMILGYLLESHRKAAGIPMIAAVGAQHLGRQSEFARGKRQKRGWVMSVG